MKYFVERITTRSSGRRTDRTTIGFLTNLIKSLSFRWFRIQVQKCCSKVSNKNFLRKNQTSNIFNFRSWKLRDNRYTNKVKLADLDALVFPFKMCYCPVTNEKSRKVWSTWLVDHSLHSKWNVTLFCSLRKMKGLIMIKLRPQIFWFF